MARLISMLLHSRVLKRAVDVVGASIGLTVLAPVIAWTALALLVAQGRPILFRQQRPGLRGRPFTLLKFRTMRSPVGGELWHATDDVRVTRIGRLLRRTSMDELPELWNVIRGDMSLVGPRPLLMGYLGVYTPEEMRRHDVRPGITGLAAISGRHTLPFEERLRLDVWYVDHWSIRVDVQILAVTVRQVLRREGVSTVQDLTEIGFPARFQAGLDRASDPPAASAH